MIIGPVTSLADLEFKARTNKYYKQLAILGCDRIGYNISNYERVMKRLHWCSVHWGYPSCEPIIQEINFCCNLIVEEKPSTVKKLIIVKRKKYKSVKKPKLNIH